MQHFLSMNERFFDFNRHPRRMLHNVLPHGILGGSPAHEEHHNGGKRHYQQFFLYLDYFIGAINNDDRKVERKAETEMQRPIRNGHSFKSAYTLRPVMPVN